MAFTGVENFKNGVINREEVVGEWKQYIETVEEEEISPILARMEQAKSDYFNSVIDLLEKKDELEVEYGKAGEIVRPINEIINFPRLTTERNRQAFIVANELVGLMKDKKLGRGVSRV